MINGLSFGKRIYFLNIIENDMKETLIDSVFLEGYEIYISETYMELNTLPENEYFKNSLVFIYIDENTNKDDLLFYIKYVNKNFEDINTGFYLVSNKIIPDDIIDFKSAGIIEFIKFSENKNDNINKIKNILTLNKAKGRRQQVRVKCEKLRNNYIKIYEDDFVYEGKIINISAKALACNIINYENISINQHFKKIEIKLDDMQYIISGKVYEIYNGILNENDIIVFLFDEAIEELYYYIFENVQNYLK